MTTWLEAGERMSSLAADVRAFPAERISRSDGPGSRRSRR
ncbi:hypothetical protein [Streptomyces sp. NPDC060198]